MRNKFRTGYHNKKEFSMGTGATLMCIIEGGATFDTGKIKFNAFQGDWIFWNPQGMAEYRPLVGNHYSSLLISFLPITANGNTDKDPLELEPHFQLIKQTIALEIMKEIINKLRSGQTDKNLACARLGLELMEIVDKERVSPNRKLKVVETDIDQRIRSTLLFINDNFKKRLPVAELARKVSMHPVHFTRLFIKCTGISPHNYVLEKKIEKAKDFITILGDNPDSTSLELGFHDYSHFYRTFKRFTGLTPTAYIKAFRKIS